MISNSNKSQFNEMMQGMSPEEEMDESDEYTDSESDENEDGFDLQKLLAPFGYIQREYFITNRVLGRIQLINGKLTLKSLQFLNLIHFFNIQQIIVNKFKT